MSFQQTTFLGASIVNFTTSLGWNHQISELTVSLVEDPNNSDSFSPVSVGTPLAFTYDGWTFIGLLQSYRQIKSVSGNPVYEVKLKDPREILSGVQLILSGYEGIVYDAPNIINIFGYIENNSGFGSAGVNDSGMLWENITTALSAILALGDIEDYGGPITYRGYEYTVDLSQLPSLPSYYRIGGDHISLLDFISEVTDAASSDYFVTLVPSGDDFVITVNVVPRLTTPTFGKIQDFIDSATNVVSSEVGRELSGNTNGKFLVGGDVEDLFFQTATSFGRNYNSSLGSGVFQNTLPGSPASGVNQNLTNNTIWPFWGFDANGNVVASSGTGDSHTITLDSRYVNVSGVGSTYIATVKELRAAIMGQEEWETMLWNLNDTSTVPQYQRAEQLGLIGNIKKEMATFLGGKTIPQIEALTPLDFQGLTSTQIGNAGKGGESRRDEDIRKVYDFVKGVADTFYGKQFLVQVPDLSVALDSDTNKLVTSLEPTSSAFIAEDLYPTAIVNSLIPLDFDRISDQDGKLEAYVRFDNVYYGLVVSDDPENSANIYYGADGNFRRIIRVNSFNGFPLPTDNVLVNIFNDDTNKTFTGFEPYRFDIRIGEEELRVVMADIDDGDYNLVVERLYGPLPYSHSAGAEIFSNKNDYSEISTDDLLLSESADSVFVRCQVSPEIVFLDRDALTYPRVIIELPGKVKIKSGDRFDSFLTDELKSVIMDQNGSAAQAKAISKKLLNMAGSDQLLMGLESPLAYPQLAAIPLRSNVLTYGPWVTFGTSGKMDFEKDTTLVPWNYGGFTGLDLIGNAKVQELSSELQEEESGSVEFNGVPVLSLGSQLVSGGPYVTDISTSIGNNQASTSYRMQTWTQRFGKGSRDLETRLRKFAKQASEARRTFRQLAKKPLPKNATFFKNREGSLVNRDKPSSSHYIISGELVPISGDYSKINVVIQPAYNLIEQCGDNYANKAFASLDLLFVPFGDGSGLPRLGENIIPYVFGETDSDNIINLIARGSGVPDDLIVQHSGENTSQYRGIAFKGSPIICGPGYIYPIGSEEHASCRTVIIDDITLQPSSIPDIETKPNLWKVGPLNTWWNAALKTWEMGVIPDENGIKRTTSYFDNNCNNCDLLIGKTIYLDNTLMSQRAVDNNGQETDSPGASSGIASWGLKPFGFGLQVSLGHGLQFVRHVSGVFQNYFSSCTESGVAVYPTYDIFINGEELVENSPYSNPSGLMWIPYPHHSGTAPHTPINGYFDPNNINESKSGFFGIKNGCGLGFGSDGSLQVNGPQLAGSGLVWDSNNCRWDVTNVGELEVGCGLTYTSGVLSFNGLNVAGSGLLANSGNCTIDVNVGCGIQISGDAVMFKRQDILGSGLISGPGTCDIDINAGCNLKFESGELLVNTPVLAGSGLIGGSCEINILTGCGLTIDGNNKLSLDNTTFAGSGLFANSGDCSQINVNVGCGLMIGSSNEIKFKNADVASSGLIAISGDCSLQTNIGSGLFFDTSGKIHAAHRLTDHIDFCLTQIEGDRLEGTVPVWTKDSTCGVDKWEDRLLKLEEISGIDPSLPDNRDTSKPWLKWNNSQEYYEAVGLSIGDIAVAGCGIDIQSSGISIKRSDLLAPGSGLFGIGTCGFGVNLGCGLKIGASGSPITIDNVILASSGLQPINSCSLAVKIGSGLKFETDGSLSTIPGVVDTTLGGLSNVDDDVDTAESLPTGQGNKPTLFGVVDDSHVFTTFNLPLQGIQNVDDDDNWQDWDFFVWNSGAGYWHGVQLELDHATDVDAPTPNDGDLLMRDTTGSGPGGVNPAWIATKDLRGNYTIDGELDATTLKCGGVSACDWVFDKYFDTQILEEDKDQKLYTYDEMLDFIEKNHHFPHISGRGNKNRSVSEQIDGLVTTIEHLMLYIKELKEKYECKQ